MTQNGNRWPLNLNGQIRVSKLTLFFMDRCAFTVVYYPFSSCGLITHSSIDTLSLSDTH